MASSLAWFTLLASYSQGFKKPNIILIVADDLGWNDVGWNNGDMYTPNLDTLAYEGVILNQSYVHSVCSPSRAALLSGYYPFRMGLQHGVIRRDKPQGIPLSFTLLPERLRNAGYATHIVGKWHLGFCDWDYTPTFRGFDSFMGFYSGASDYYSHVAGKGENRGYDYRFNTKVYRPKKRRYSTVDFKRRVVDIIMNDYTKKPLFIYLSFQSVHSPLEAPRKFISKYSWIRDKSRRTFSGMVTAMDDVMGEIIGALMQRGIYDNTLIVFTSDNGGNPHVGGNNWPLRGAKGTLFEGGTRVPSFVWGKMLNRTKHVHNGLVHITDWTPTLLEVAGVNPGARNIHSCPSTTPNLQLMTGGEGKFDGVSQWGMLSQGRQSARSEFVYGINELTGGHAIRMGRYKMIEGPPGASTSWYYPGLHYHKHWIHRKVQQDTYFNQTLLFDLDSDPLEIHNIAESNPLLVTRMKIRLGEYLAQIVPSHNPRKIRKSHPKRWGRVWSPGWCVARQYP